MAEPFVFDIYKDWTPEQLKERCMQLVRSVGELQLLVGMLVEYRDVEQLPADLRDKAKRIRSAWDD